MMFLKQLAWLAVGAILILSGVFGYYLISWIRATPASTSQRLSEPEPILLVVKTVVPRIDPQFVRSVVAPAYVEAYEKADLFAHVAGPVKFIEKNIGDLVMKDELLVEIDVPDLVQEIAQKEALIQQAQAVRDAASAHVKTLTEALETAKLVVPEKESYRDQMLATRDLRFLEWARFKSLLEQKATNKDLVEEHERDYKVSIAVCKTSELAIATARSEVHAAEAKLEEARADLKVKESHILVAQKDKQKMQAQADWARIRAPFNGVITRRSVDPGSFVQNATTARTEPMLTLMRNDIVTIAMLVPERSAAYIRVGQEAIINMEVEPGKKIKNFVGKVTRFSPTLDRERGRTKRVEVDLYNPPRLGFRRSTREGVCSFLSPLGAADSLGAIALWRTGQQLWKRPGLLDDGMYGEMKVILERYANPYLIPSAAVFNYQGRTCVLLVHDHVAHRVQVQVQLEDGVQAKVAVVVREANPASGDDDVTRDLTGDEEIIVSGQGEVADGQKIRTVIEPW